MKNLISCIQVKTIRILFIVFLISGCTSMRYHRTAYAYTVWVGTTESSIYYMTDEYKVNDDNMIEMMDSSGKLKIIPMCNVLEIQKN